MPGVPTFRGCEACHRQKKKCDEQQPSCSRCTRLRISCDGRGSVRFKFVNSSAEKPPSPPKAAVVKASSQTRGRDAPPRRLVPSPVNYAITNQTARLACAFVSVLQVADLRYDVTCYGGWLLDLPRRLGTNQALDAAVTAVSASFPAVHSKQVTGRAIGSYVKALEILRHYLADPRKARTPETLCAIYLVMVCQGWIGDKSDDDTAHISGMAYLLQSGDPGRELDVFEKAVRRTIGVSVIIGCVFNPSIRVANLEKILSLSEGPRSVTKTDGSHFSSLEMAALARVPDHLQRPFANLPSIRKDYEVLKVDVGAVYKVMKKHEETFLASQLGFVEPDPSATRKLSTSQAAYGVILGLSVSYGKILSTVDPADQITAGELQIHADLVLEFAEYVSAYRPLGASYMTLPLAAAWAATPVGSKRTRIEELLRSYRSDFPRNERATV